MSLVHEHAKPGSVSTLCKSLGVSRATYYRRKKEKPLPKKRPPSHRRLSQEERETVLDTLSGPGRGNIIEPPISD